MKRNDIEGPIHRAILNYLKLQYPRAVIHHSPNEMNIKADHISKAIAQNKAKAMGMQPGWPDIEMLLDGQMYFFEVKAPKGVVSTAQAACGARIEAAGGRFYVVRSIEDVKAAMAARHESVVEIPIVGVIS